MRHNAVAIALYRGSYRGMVGTVRKIGTNKARNHIYQCHAASPRGVESSRECTAREHMLQKRYSYAAQPTETHTYRIEYHSTTHQEPTEKPTETPTEMK